ncbi:MAG: ABC transporter ATP-binding protein [Chlorobi bacterium]|nr:ABC transporter ATP-binding protein [Chlorobiota bacterium]
MTRVRVEWLTKQFGNITAIRQLTLTVEPGEFLVVVGPSGCGKSTLLRVIAGLEHATSGEIYFDDEPISARPPQERDVGMVFQNYALYPHMTVAENLAFPLRVRKVSRVERDGRIRHIAAMLGLEKLLDRLPKQLSGGQQQRVAVGRALVRSPRVFLFDEPLSNLDTNLRAEMRMELAALQRQVGITTLYVTHDHTEAMTMGDRLAILRGGELVQVGTPQQLYSDPEDLFVASFLGMPAINTIDGVLQHTGVQIVVACDGFAIGLEGLLEKHWLGQAVTVAVRPEHIHRVPEGDADMHGIVEMVEFVGHEQLVRVRIGGTLLTMRLSTADAVRVGEVVGVRFDRCHLLLFNSSGKRIR